MSQQTGSHGLLNNCQLEVVGLWSWSSPHLGGYCPHQSLIPNSAHQNTPSASCLTCLLSGRIMLLLSSRSVGLIDQAHPVYSTLTLQGDTLSILANALD